MIPAAPAMCILSRYYVLHDYLAGIPICRMECLCKESKSVCVPLIGSTGLCFAVPSRDAELLFLMRRTLLVVVTLWKDSYKTF